MPSKYGYNSRVDKEYRSRRWRNCTTNIKKKRHYTCEICGSYGYLVHHIIEPDEESMDSDPERFYDEDNLILLCKPCHNRLHWSQGDFKGQTPSAHIVRFDEKGQPIIYDRPNETLPKKPAPVVEADEQKHDEEE